VAQVAVCSQINTKHILVITLWAKLQLLNVKLVVHHVTGRLYKGKKIQSSEAYSLWIKYLKYQFPLHNKDSAV
jgi:hypothetical protein